MRIARLPGPHPATDKIGHLFPGSWISTISASGSATPSATAPGTCCARRAQCLVEDAAQGDEPAAADLRGPGKSCTSPREATGSGGSATHHSSSQDGLFDRLFRKHLQNVYTLLGARAAGRAAPADPPAASPQLRPISEPTGLLKVQGRRPANLLRVDQRRALRRLAGSRHDEHGRQRADRHDLYFGFDTERLLLRFDCARPRSASNWPTSTRCAIVFLQPEGFELRRDAPGHCGADAAAVPPRRAGERRRASRRPADAILEIGIPFRSLAAETDEPVQFYVELLRQEQSIERIPHEGAIETDGSLARLRTDYVASVNCRDRFRKPSPNARFTQRSDRRPLGDYRQEPRQAAARFRSTSVRDQRRAASAHSARATKTTRPARSSPTASPARTATARAGGCAWCRTSSRPWRSKATEQARRGHLRHDARRRRARGDHRIARHLTEHRRTVRGKLREVFWVYRDRLVDLKKDPRLVYGMIFKNVGAAAGAVAGTHPQPIDRHADRADQRLGGDDRLAGVLQLSRPLRLIAT